jgi:Tol biopolymer transport system component
VTEIGCFPTHQASEPKTGERIQKNTTKLRMDTMKPVGSKTIRSALCSGLFFSLLLTFFACGGGDDKSSSAPPTEVEPVKVSGTPIPTAGGLRSIDAFTWAPDSSRIAYIAAQDSNSEELYSSTPDGVASNVKVSGGGTVESFLWSPDLTAANLIAYLADQQTINVNELYTSTPEGNDNQNVSGSLEPGGRVTVFYDWAFSASGTSPLVFMAEKDSATNVELYASFDNGATVVKLSGDIIPAGGNVVDFAVSPDGLQVAYKADQQVFGKFELYVVPVSTSGGTAINVSRQSTNILEVRDFAWSFDNETIAFRAFNPVPNTIGNVELFTVPASGGTPVRVSVFPNPDGEVSSFDWAPSDLLIAYTQNTIQGSPDRIDLYSTRPFRQDNNKLSNTTGTGSSISTVRSFKWSPDSLLIAFNVVVRGSGLSELLVVDPAVSFPTPVPLSGTLQSLGEVVGFEWSPDSIRVAYRADQFVDNRFDLLTVLANGSRPPDLISRLANDSSEVRDFAWAPDSSRIAYIADQDTVGVFELYTDNTFGTSNRRVSAELSVGENVSALLWAPDGQLIAYQANQDDINIDELYTTVP